MPARRVFMLSSPSLQHSVILNVVSFVPRFSTQQPYVAV
jgi:hypothetical protein